MKNFAFGMIAAILLCAALAAEGGYSVVWQYEMTRPEAQKAIGEWVGNNCDVMLSPWEIKNLSKDMQAPDAAFEHLHIACRASK